MKKTLVLTLIFWVLAVGGWWLLGPAHLERHAYVLGFESDQTEALVNRIIQEGDADGPKGYLLTFGDNEIEPSRLFIARFARHDPPVHGLGKSGAGPEAVVIQVLRLQKINPGTVDALVQFPNQPAGQNRYTYRLLDQDGVWAVKWRLAVNKIGR